METNSTDNFTDLDVIGGRGNKSTNHIGNIKFRELIEEHYEEYTRIIGETERKQRQERIVQQVHNYGGRFLDKPDKDKNGERKELNGKEAMQKVRQCFSDHKKKLQKAETKAEEAKAEAKKSPRQHDIKNGFAPGALPLVPTHPSLPVEGTPTTDPSPNANDNQWYSQDMLRVFADNFRDNFSDSLSNSSHEDNNDNAEIEINPIPLCSITSETTQIHTNGAAGEMLHQLPSEHANMVSLTSVDLAEQQDQCTSLKRDPIISLPKPYTNRNQTENSLDVTLLEKSMEVNCRRLSEMSIDVTRRPSGFTMDSSARQLSLMSIDSTTPNSRRPSFNPFSSQMSLDTVDALKEIAESWSNEVEEKNTNND